MVFPSIVAVPASAMTLFTTEMPAVEADSDTAATELGVRFRSTVAGMVTGVRFYKGAGNTGAHIGSLWSNGGTRLAQVTFTGETVGGWQQANFSTPISVAANTTYVASYHAPNGHYSITEHFFTSAWVVGIMRAPAQAGVYKYGAAGSFPNQRFEDSSYFVDVVFEPTDTAAPTAPGSVAASGVTSASAHLSWTASTDDVGVTGYEVLRGGAVVAMLAASARSYDFSGLAETTSYALGVRAVDGVGNRSATSSVSLTTPVAQSAYTLFAPDAVPDIVDTNDTGAVELGVKFTSDVAGTIRGVRFYKAAANTGTHTGSLWSSSGTRLATATFVAEGPSGWQTVLFASPVTISANTTYVASYHLNVGHYSATEDALDAAGIDSPPLHAPRSSTIGGNGVYRYGASAFPNNTYRASNYFVDPLFLPLSSLSPRSVDGSGATVAWQSPASSLAAEWAPPAAEAATIASYDWCFTASTQDNCAAPLTGTNASGNQAGTSVTATGLTLTPLTATYRVCVRPRYAAGGVIGAWACSAGVRVDDAAPAAPATVLDGAGATDIAWLASRSTHAASWTAASDGSGAGVSHYEWCLSTTTGCASGVAASGATSNASTLSASLTGLDLTEGARYYFCVRARDNAGNAGAYGCSNGVDVDTTGPTNPAVSDGLDVDDVDWQASTNLLAAQWGVGSDATSGVASYDWCVSTVVPGLACVDGIASGTDSGQRSISLSGLGLAEIEPAYVTCVRARDAASNVASGWSCSDGVRIDVTAPDAPELVAPEELTTLAPGAASVALEWDAATDARSGVASYEYQLAEIGALGAASWVPVSGLAAEASVEADTTYSWRVRAVDVVGNVSSVSETWTFEVPAAPGGVELVTSASVVAVGEEATLTATVVEPLEPNEYLQVYDVLTGQRVAYCASTSCQATVMRWELGAGRYVALVAPYASTLAGATEVRETSEEVEVSLLPYVLDLTVSSEVVDSQTPAVLTATANQSVQNTPYRLLVVNETTGVVERTCFAGPVCQTTVTRQSAGTHHYRAYVATGFAAGPVGAVAQSPEVGLTQLAFDGGLEISQPVVRTDETATIRFEVNQSVSNTPYRLMIFNLTTGLREQECFYGTVCEMTRSKAEAGTFEYQAFVAEPTSTVPASPVFASGVVELTQLPFLVDLEVSKSVLSTEEVALVTATANQSVGGTPYNLSIVNTTTGAVVRCVNVAVCSFTQDKKERGEFEFQAYVAEYGAEAPAAAVVSSNVRSISQLPWLVSFGTTPLPGGGGFRFLIEVNQSVSNTPYVMRGVAHYYDGTNVVISCTSGRTCSGSLPVVRDIVVGYEIGVPGISSSSTSPNELYETTGGCNPSEASTQQCVADPVSTYNGRFHLARTDVAAAGRGMPLRFDRTYTVDRAREEGELGHGWRHNFEMELRPYDRFRPMENLAQSRRIAVVQENGSQLVYEDWGVLGMRAPNRVRATLHRNADGTFTFVRRKRETFTFNANGRLTSVENRNGVRFTVHRDALDRLVAVTSNDGRRLDFEHDAAGRITSVTEGGQSTTQFGYDAEGQLMSSTDPDSKAEGYVYDDRRRMTSITDPRGKVTTNSYDLLDRVTAQTDPLGRVTSFDYDVHPFEMYDVTAVEDARGTVTEYWYVLGTLYRVVSGVGTPDESVERFYYDPSTSEVTARTDGEGNTWERWVDDDGNVLRTRSPRGRETSWTYDEYGDVLTETDPEGVTTTFARDSRGNVESVSTPIAVGGPVARTELRRDDPAHPGDVTRVVDPEGGTTFVSWTPRGMPERVVDAEGGATTYAYDALGRLESTVSPRGNEPGADPEPFTTSVVRDPVGRARQVLEPGGRTSSWTYDASGNVLSHTPPDGHVAEFTYDAAGQLRFEDRADGTRVARTYTATGQVETVTDGAQHATTYEYDRLDRVKRVVDPLGRERLYGYDDVDRVRSMQDDLGRNTSYEYDDDGQLRAIDYDEPETPDAAFTYDDAGRRLTSVDGTGTTTTAYDGLGRVTSSVDGYGREVAYDYDRAGRVTRVQYPGAGRAVSYAYDDAGRMERAEDWLGGEYAFELDPDGAVSDISFPNGVASAITRNASGEVTQLLHQRASTTLASFAYGRPASGLLASETSVGVPGAGAQSFAYDELQRLEQKTGGIGAGSFDFDDAGNLTLRGDGAVLAYDDARQLESVTPVAGVATTFGYDDLGQRTSAVTGASQVEYGYDQAGRLTSFDQTGGVDATYAYDADGMRRSKTVDGATQHMTWTTGAVPLLLDDDRFAYVYGPSGLPLAQIDTNDDVTYLHTDQLGSVRSITNATGNVAGTASYTPYGERVSTGTTSTLGYAGEYTDSESGLVYLRARFYDPATGQFLTRDPMESISGDPYGYAGGNPIMSTDPTGMLPDWLPSASDIAETSAGIGDAMSFGAFKGLRNALGGGVNECSANYAGGEVAGTALGFATGGELRGLASGIRGLGGALRNPYAPLGFAQSGGRNLTRTLENGRTRTYGPFRPARTDGTMSGAAKVREYDPVTGRTRSWTETYDQSGNVRIVRPFYGDLPHYTFGPNGGFRGTF